MGVDQFDLLTFGHRHGDGTCPTKELVGVAERSRAGESVKKMRRAFEERRNRDDELRLRHGVQFRDLHQLPRYVVIEYGARSSGTW